MPDSPIVWRQRFTLADGIVTTGTNDIDWPWQVSALPTDLTGLTVLDVGTTDLALDAVRRVTQRTASIETTVMPGDEPMAQLNRYDQFAGRSHQLARA